MASRKIVSASWFLLLTTWWIQTCWTAPEFEVGAMVHAAQKGKSKMAELTAKANVPVDGSCWKAALEDLQAGCRLITEESQARIAIRFASCFNEMVGLPPYICESVTPVKDCVKGLDIGGLATFREYFLHTQDMCYYLRQEMWQEETNNAVNRLTETAEDVTVQMYEQKYIQEQIFSSQQESLKVQTNLKKDNEDLYSAVVRVKDVFEDFSETAKQHQHISTDIFDRLTRMQKLVSWIQGEMSLFDMIFFYLGAMVFGYFATATNRTRGARFWLVVLFMLCIWAEKVLFNYLTQPGVGFDLTPEDVQWYIWMLRKFAALIGSVIVLISGALYRDIQTANNNMLMNMNFALEKVVQFINDQKVNTSSDLNFTEDLSGSQALMEQHSDSDSFSDYSSDDSADNLEHELKELAEKSENAENVEPNTSTGSSVMSRFFGREANAQDQMPLRMRHQYNLRERSSTPREVNPMIHEESVSEFAKAVKKRKVPARRSDQAHYNYFSSDDE